MNQDDAIQSLQHMVMRTI